MTQKGAIVEYMRSKGSITQREAVWLGCYRLSARIFDLRNDGYEIRTERENVTTKTGGLASIARYSLKEDES